MTVAETRAHAREHDLTSIQCLRGVAATMVVVFHAVSHSEHIRDPQGLVRALAAGVDIFFVISGFIMLYSAHRAPGRGGGRFLLNRIVRIAPMYWLLTTLTVLIAVALPHAMRNGRFELHHAVLSYLFLPALHPVSGMYEPILIPGWTLNYEMFFYAIFACGLWLARGRTDVLLGSVVAAIVAVVLLPHLVPVGGVARFYTAGIVLEFAYGLLVCRLFLAGFRVSRPASVALIVAGAAGYLASPLFDPDTPRELLYGIPALLVFTGTASLRPDPRNAAIVPLRIVGDASYSLYLVHPMLVSAYGQAWHRLGLERLPGQEPLFVLSAVVLCVAVAFLLYRFVEQPIIERARRMVWLRPRAGG